MTQAANEALRSWTRWRSGETSAFSEAISRADSLSAKPLVVLLLAHQYEHWKSGDRIPAEDYLVRHPALHSDDEAACDLVYGEFVLRELLGESPNFQDYVDRFPQLANELKQLFEFERITGAVAWFPMSAVDPRESTTVKSMPLDKCDPAVMIPDYELICRIGSGAFGQVWLARNRHDQGYCAVKVIVAHSDVELDGVRLYRACASDHPYLVPIKHVGEVDMFYYYVMPLADDARGASLSDAPELYVALTLKRDLEDRAGPASLDELLTIARNLLKALEHLHSNGVRHCDVKLENVMRFERIWRLGDIGLARRDGEFGSSRGTMAYWPPEGPRELSSDLYALGKTLLLYAAGGPLHQSPGELLKCLIVPGDERRVARLKEILGRACHLDPRQRYQFANEMLRDVERVGPRAARRRIQVALAGLGLVLFAILWTVFHREQPRKLLRLEADRSGQAKDNEATVLAKSRSSPEPDWARPPNELLEERNAELGKRIVDLRHEGRWTEAAAVVREMANLLDKFSLGKHVNNEMTRDTLKQMETIAALPRVDQEEMRQVEHLVDKVTALRADNKNEEALREEYHVYEIRHRILGDNFVEVAAGLIHIGYIQGLLDQKSEAVDSIGKAVRILEKVLTKDHDEIAKCYHNLGFHKFELGRIPEAEVLFRKALDIRVRILGKHFFTAITYSCLVHLYVERFAKARESDRSGWRIKAVECLGGLKEIAQEYEHRAMQFEVLLPMADEKRAKYFRDQIQTYQSDSIQMKAWIDSLEKKHGPNLSNPSLER